MPVPIHSFSTSLHSFAFSFDKFRSGLNKLKFPAQLVCACSAKATLLETSVSDARYFFVKQQPTTNNFFVFAPRIQLHFIVRIGSTVMQSTPKTVLSANVTHRQVQLFGFMIKCALFKLNSSR